MAWRRFLNHFEKALDFLAIANVANRRIVFLVKTQAGQSQSQWEMIVKG
jgi:hypothetical protein